MDERVAYRIVCQSRLVMLLLFALRLELTAVIQWSAFKSTVAPLSLVHGEAWKQKMNF